MAIALAAIVNAPLAQAQPKWADPAKTLRVTFPIAETGFDPQATSDYYSSHVERAIFDPLYEFDYLARPYKIVPNTAAAMPDGAERNKILQRMSELVTAYSPWNLHAYRYENVLVQPWLSGYKYNAFNRHPWAYYDVDSKRRKPASP